MESKQTVLAFFEAKPDKIEEVKQALTALLAPTRQEQGCINYDLHQSADDPTKFMFHENWTSKEALAKHAASRHLEAWRTIQEDLLAKPGEVSIWSGEISK